MATARLASFWPTIYRSSSETISRGKNWSRTTDFLRRRFHLCICKYRPRFSSPFARCPPAPARSVRTGRGRRQARTTHPSRSRSTRLRVPEHLLVPVSTGDTSNSATAIMASRRRRYRSVRQSLASSTQARVNWPGCCSSFPSNRSNRVSICGGAGKSGDHTAVAQRANLARIRFHDRVAERHLTVAGDNYLTVFANRKNCRSVPGRNITVCHRSPNGKKGWGGTSRMTLSLRSCFGSGRQDPASDNRPARGTKNCSTIMRKPNGESGLPEGCAWRRA